MIIYIFLLNIKSRVYMVEVQPVTTGETFVYVEIMFADDGYLPTLGNIIECPCD